MLNHLLSGIVFAPLVAAIALLFLPRDNRDLIRRAGIALSGIPLLLSLILWELFRRDAASQFQFAESAAWIPTLGARYHLAVDGLSLPLVLLTTILTTLTLIYSIRVEDRVKEYYALFLLLESAMLGVFLSLDIFLFYIFWEVSLVPMYFIIGIWGGPRREYAAIKFFLYTLVGSVAMLLALIYVRSLTGSFDIADWISIHPLPTAGLAQTLVFWAFFIGFAIKVPLFPFHTWLPDAHVEAPTGGSIILAGVLLKLGGYGILRICLGVFPNASMNFAGIIGVLATIAIVYGALVAMAQWDFKKLIAYTSVNHMGYVMLGVAAAAWPTNGGGNVISLKATALNGASYQMLAHGIITGALFLLVGVIYDRAHTRDLAAFGGLLAQMPIYGGLFITAAMASLGLPGMAGFIAEFQTFVGAFGITPLLAGISSIGIVVTAALLLWTVQRVFLGPLNPKWAELKDVEPREWIPLAILAALMIFFGLYPKPILDLINPVSLSLSQGLIR